MFLQLAALPGLPRCCWLLNSAERNAVSFESDNDTQYTTEANSGDSNDNELSFNSLKIDGWGAIVAILLTAAQIFSQSEHCVNREYTCAIFPFPDYVQQTTLASFRHRSVKEGRSYLRRETKRFNVWVGHKKGGVLCADDWGILITTRWQSAPMTSSGLASHNNASSRRCSKKTPQFMRF